MTTRFKKYFVFDLDDTLVDGRQFCGETIARVITRFDPGADFKKIIKLHEELHGLAVTDLYAAILKEIGLERKLGGRFEEMLNLDKQIQTKDISRLKIFDGVPEILQFLKSQKKEIYMCTNRMKSLLDLALEYNGIRKYFTKVVSCLDAGFKKPNPACLERLVNESEANKQDFIYFGDSVVDSQFAQNAGIEHIIFDQYLNDKNIFKKLINMFLEEKLNGFSGSKLQ
jgi:HAD superfamily hydrolase (TIGR01509 family)